MIRSLALGCPQRQTGGLAASLLLGERYAHLLVANLDGARGLAALLAQGLRVFVQLHLGGGGRRRGGGGEEGRRVQAKGERRWEIVKETDNAHAATSSRKLCMLCSKSRLSPCPLSLHGCLPGRVDTVTE